MASEPLPPSVDADDEGEDELVKVPRRKGAADEEMDITPMIDITFLLLIFFIVSSNMNPEQALDLPKAKHGGSIVAPDSVIILVRQGSGETAQVFTPEGREFPGGDLAAQEDEIAAYVEAGVNGAPPFDSPKKQVLLKAEAGVKTGEVGRIKEAAEKSLTEEHRVFIGIMQEG